MIVNQSISFQRGLDPHKALQIGIEGSGLQKFCDFIFGLDDSYMGWPYEINQIWFISEKLDPKMSLMLIPVGDGKGNPQKLITENETFKKYFVPEGFNSSSASGSDVLQPFSHLPFFFVGFYIKPEWRNLITAWGHKYVNPHKRDPTKLIDILVWVIGKEDIA